MKAIYRGYISIDRNAVFSVSRQDTAFGICDAGVLELRDDIDPEQKGFVIGQEYEIDGLVKAAAH